MAAWLAVAFKLDEVAGGDFGEAVANAFECAGDAGLDKTAGLGESDADDPVGLAFPGAEGMLGEECAGFKADLEVIDAEVGGVGVGHVNGDEGNVGALEDVGNAGGDVLGDLELEDKIDALLHEGFSVLDGGVGVVAVVELEQLNAGSGGGGGDALGYGDGEGHLSALGGEAEAEAAGAGDEAIGSVLRLGDVAAMDEGFEDAVDGGFGDFGALEDVLEGEGTVVLLKKLEDVEGFGEDGDEVEALDFGFGQRMVSVGRVPS